MEISNQFDGRTFSLFGNDSVDLNDFTRWTLRRLLHFPELVPQFVALQLVSFANARYTSTSKHETY